MSFDDWADRSSIDNYHRVATDHVGPFYISTVWLGINHADSGAKEPVIFETVIFGGDFNEEGKEYVERYSTEAQALAGHRRAVDHARAKVKPI